MIEQRWLFYTARVDEHPTEGSIVVSEQGRLYQKLQYRKLKQLPIDNWSEWKPIDLWTEWTDVPVKWMV